MSSGGEDVPLSIAGEGRKFWVIVALVEEPEKNGKCVSRGSISLEYSNETAEIRCDVNGGEG